MTDQQKTDQQRQLPPGVFLRDLKANRDDRGDFTEVFRASWDTGVKPVQWNIVRSHAGVLRGVHVHHQHADYLLLTQGRMTLGLHDMRPASPRYGQGMTVELRADPCVAVVIPVGVAHGFLFSEESMHLYAVTEYWSLADELGCRWDDPALAIDWPIAPTLVSQHDRELQSTAALLAELVAHQHKLWPPSTLSPGQGDQTGAAATS